MTTEPLLYLCSMQRAILFAFTLSLAPPAALLGNRPAQAPLFDMEKIRDARTLEIEILSDWHEVAGKVPTRQKIITIKVGEIWPGRDFRMPVRFVVPANAKAEGFHLTGGHNPKQFESDWPIRGNEENLLRGNVGLVQTIIQVLQVTNQGELAQESEQRFLQSLNPHDKIQYWAWPATLMRAVTAAHAESDHFVPGKIAMSGGSKNGASPSLALIHDDRLTAVHATVSPVWDSPLRLVNEEAMREYEALAGDNKEHRFLAGHFGPNYNYQALRAGRSWEELRKFAEDVSGQVFISRNLEALRARKVDMFLEPGTHDFVAYDAAWGGKHRPSIPIYYTPNSGHGIKPPHPMTLKVQNRDAFLQQHFFGEDALLTPPQISTKVADGKLHVTVKFREGSNEEDGRLFWIYDRAPEGSPDYIKKRIPEENWADMSLDQESQHWTAAIDLDPKAHQIDVFSNHRKASGQGQRTLYSGISSPYTRVQLK